MLSMRRNISVVLLVLVCCAFSGPVWASADADYARVRDQLTAFKQNKAHHKYRDKWMQLIEGFEKIQQRYPTHKRACDALYNIGMLYREMSEISHLAADRRQAAEYFERLATRCGDSNLADDGLYWAGTLHIRLGDTDKARQVLSRVVTDYPAGDMAPSARVLLEQIGGPLPPAAAPAPAPPPARTPPPAAPEKRADTPPPPAPPPPESFPERGEVLIAPAQGQADLTGLTQETDAAGTRLSLMFSRLPAMTSGEVAATGELPRRLYFDFVNARLGSGVPATLEVGDERVTRIRIGQFGPTVVRVVFELTPRAGGFGLANQLAPASATITIKPLAAASPAPTQAQAPARAPSSPPPVARQEEPAPVSPPATRSDAEGQRPRIVVIDPGHGGDDTGAIGAKGTKEKDITLALARKVKAMLEKRGVTVILTRNSDVTMDLFSRTKVANDANADLFVSIHCNANRQRHFSGVEVFYLNNSSDTYSTRLADRENKVMGKPVSDLDFILTDLSMNVNVGDSILLANMVQRSMVKQLRRKYPDIVDRGVKRAVFHVLLYARMPAVLVEASFLSNLTEEARLRTAAYQDIVAEGIVAGIMLYFDKVQVTAGLN